MSPRRDSPWPSRCDTVAVCQPEIWRFEMSASWLRLFGLMIVSAWLAIGCSGPSKIEVGGTCVMNSDCNDGLVCTWGKCHTACHTSADCPAGESCLTASDESNVCQLPVETHCLYASDCPSPLTCAVDQQCRNQCQKDMDCPTGQICTTTKTCAEPNQVDSNKNLFPPDGGFRGAGGASGTDANASCQTGAETCSCYANATCNTGLTCASNLCVRLGATGGAGGTTGDAKGAGGSTGTGGATSTGGADAGTAIGTGGMGGAGGGTTSADGGGCPAGRRLVRATETARATGACFVCPISA
jgi:Cys-rich repeat protein